MLGRRRRRYPSLQASPSRRTIGGKVTTWTTLCPPHRNTKAYNEDLQRSLRIPRPPQDEGLQRGPTTKSSYPTSSPNLEAHAGFGPM
jgi:hypothetical protein